MLANFAGDLKGLPCEIVDEILEYLVGDLSALKVCSLTCKVLLRSARRIIHRRLRIRGWVRSCPLDEHEIRAANLADFRPLLVAAKCGLTCYTRELTINLGGNFHPTNLRPFLPQFQTLTRVTSLPLLYFHPTPFLLVFEQYFGGAPRPPATRTPGTTDTILGIRRPARFPPQSTILHFSLSKP